MPDGWETRYGVLNVLMSLPGVGGYDLVAKGAKRYAFENHVLVVASIDDIITSKETIGSSKDWRAMDSLYEARERARIRTDEYELGSQQLYVSSDE